MKRCLSLSRRVLLEAVVEQRGVLMDMEKIVLATISAVFAAKAVRLTRWRQVELEPPRTAASIRHF